MHRGGFVKQRMGFKFSHITGEFCRWFIDEPWFKR